MLLCRTGISKRIKNEAAGPYQERGLQTRSPEAGSIRPAYAKDSQFYISNKKRAKGEQEALRLKKKGEKTHNRS